MKSGIANAASVLAEPGASSRAPKAERANERKSGELSGESERQRSKPPGKNPLDLFINFFSSLRLTVVLLGLGMVLVFVGTIAQVDLGLYTAQNEFFRSFFVYWGPKGATWKIPVFPAGYTVGTMLLLNLITAHFKRFHFSKKKIGIWMTHIGLILLLVGQLLTDMLSRESHMWLSEGQAKNYSDSSAHMELAVIDTTNPDYDEVVAFPEDLVAEKRELKNPALPFTIRVKDYFANSEPQVRAPMMAKGPPQASQGVGQRVEFSESATTTSMDSRNIPAAVLEVNTDQGSLGTWAVSSWIIEEKLVQILDREFRNQVGPQLGGQLSSVISQPQEFEFKGHTYQIALRPVRFYKPFGIELLKFSHDKYAGTDTPKNFSSRIHLSRSDTGEDREVLIRMNTPLRYAGETFYQSGFDDVDPRVTILQVVHNPSWLAPYFACILVGAGLLVQFITHLVGFAAKRRTL